MKYGLGADLVGPLASKVGGSPAQGSSSTGKTRKARLFFRYRGDRLFSYHLTSVRAGNGNSNA